MKSFQKGKKKLVCLADITSRNATNWIATDMSIIVQSSNLINKNLSFYQTSPKADTLELSQINAEIDRLKHLKLDYLTNKATITPLKSVENIDIEINALSEQADTLAGQQNWITTYTNSITRLIYEGKKTTPEKDYARNKERFIVSSEKFISPMVKKLLALIMLIYCKEPEQEIILKQSIIKEWFIPERLNDNPDKAKKYFYNTLLQIKQAFEILENITIYRDYKGIEQEFSLIEKNPNRLKNKAYSIVLTDNFYNYLKENKTITKINTRIFELDNQNEIFTLGLKCCEYLYRLNKGNYSSLEFKTVAGWNVDLNLEQATKYRQFETKIYKPIIDRLKELERLGLFTFNVANERYETRDFESLLTVKTKLKIDTNNEALDRLKIHLHVNQYTPLNEWLQVKSKKQQTQPRRKKKTKQ